jgi:hypothetical protein
MGHAIPIQSILDPLEAVKEQAHQLVDQWVEQLRPLLEQQKPPTLLESKRSAPHLKFHPSNTNPPME